MNKNCDYSYHLKVIAENGFVGGLRALSDLVKSEAPKVTSWAAEYGRLAFLREMNLANMLFIPLQQMDKLNVWNSLSAVLELNI